MRARAMTYRRWLAGLAVVVGGAVSVAPAGAAGPVCQGFDSEPAGPLPAAWESVTGEWAIVTDASAPSQPRALSHVGKGSVAPYNISVARDVAPADLTVSVSFSSVGGRRDQGGGPVWRYKDAGNYYVCRYNPLETNYRLYRVQDNKRVQLASADVEATPGWHRIKVETVGSQIRCYYDGKLLLEATDAGLAEPGRIGLWTKADAQTAFDDLCWSPLTELPTQRKQPPMPSHGQLK